MEQMDFNKNKAEIKEKMQIRPKKILIFSLCYYPRFIGGAEIAIKEITDRISSDEIEFDMITLRLDSNIPKNEKIGNINVYRVGWSMTQKKSSDSLPWYLHLNKYFLLITGLLKALNLQRKNKYDAIWSMMASYNSFAAILFKIIKSNIPFILTLQEGDPISYIKHRALLLYPLFKMIFTKANHIQTISKYLADWAIDMNAKCPITIVPNGVSFDLFSKRDLEKESKLKANLGKKENDVFLITTSRLVIKNAVGDIIDALIYLPENVKFLILGTGYLENELNEKVKQLKLINRVKFLGYIPHSEMPNYLHISDIFIRPALSEGFGNSYIEAMAAEIPVIATPVGGIVDFLRDGETGLFCEVKNPKSIAQKVEKLIKDKESRDYIVKNAREMVKERYDWDIIANDMKKVFQSVFKSN